MNHKLPPPPTRAATPPPQAQTSGTAREFAIVSGKISGAQRIVEFGPGGVGKTSLATLVPNPVCIDLENGTREFDVPRVDGVESFADLRAVLQSSALDGFKTVIIDTMTRAEEYAVAHVLATVQNDRGNLVKNIEAYGFGKGLQHVYDAMLLLLADCDLQVRRGRNVILICHECVNEVPNPMGENYIRYEPHLQDPKSGKSSVRRRVFQWADHVLFVGYDVVSEDGKGRGAATRTIWTYELPTHMAKSRTVRQILPFKNAQDGTIWTHILGGGQ